MARRAAASGSAGRAITPKEQRVVRMGPTDNPSFRSDPRAAVRRDAARIARREPGHRSFWRSLSVLGMVGWPIALGSVGGAMLGRLLDTRFDSGVRYTLVLLTGGVLIGCLAAWKTVTQRHDRRQEVP